MDTTEVAVAVSMREDVSVKMPRVRSETQQLKTAVRELGSGTMFLGSTMVGVSMALGQMNNSMAKSASSTLAVVGGMAMAVGSAAQFVSAAAKINHALRETNMLLIVQKALSGPAGWAMLAGAGVIAGTTFANMNRGGGGSAPQKPVQINTRTTVVLDRRVLGESVRSEIVSTQKKNGGTSGIR